MKKPHLSLGIGLVLAMLLLVPAAQASIISEGVELILKQLGKKGTKEAAKELIEAGGEQGVREVLEQANREGGEVLVKKSVAFAQSHGPLALKAVKRAPKALLDALDELPPDLAQKAVHALKREPELLGSLTSQYGSKALQIAGEHPGVGTLVVQKLGREGLEVAARVDTPTMIKLAGIADPIAQLPQQQRNQLLEMLLEAPAKLISYLEKHPRVLMTSAATTAFISAKDQVLGEAELITNKDGSVQVVRKPGLLEEVVPEVTQEFKLHIGLLMGAISLFLVGRFGIKLWGTARIEKAKVKAAERKIHSESKSNRI